MGQGAGGTGIEPIDPLIAVFVGLGDMHCPNDPDSPQPRGEERESEKTEPRARHEPPRARRVDPMQIDNVHAAAKNTDPKRGQ